MEDFNSKRMLHADNMRIVNEGFVKQIETVMLKKKRTRHLVYRN